jgi:LTXXQ motif family protein
LLRRRSVRKRLQRGFDAQGAIDAILAEHVRPLLEKAQQRHWRYFGHYGYGRHHYQWYTRHYYDRAPDENANEQSARGKADASGRSEALNGRGEPGSNGMVASKSGLGSFGATLDKMIGICDGQVSELRRMPFDEVFKAVQPSGEQRDALEQIKNSVHDAADKLASACPKQLPSELGARLEIVSQLTNAILTALAPVRPTLETFYRLLDDEQKARLVAMSFSHDAQPQAERSAPSRGAAEGNEADRGPVCGLWIAMLRSLPVRQIENDITPSDEQHAALYDLASSVYRAAGNMVASCHSENHLTPVGRFDERENQLRSVGHRFDPAGS